MEDQLGGADDDAYQYYTTAIDDGTEFNVPRTVGYALVNRCEIDSRPVGERLADAAQAIAIFERLGEQLPLGRSLTALATISLLDGQVAAARDAVVRSLEIARAIGDVSGFYGGVVAGVSVLRAASERGSASMAFAPSVPHILDESVSNAEQRASVEALRSLVDATTGGDGGDGIAVPAMTTVDDAVSAVLEALMTMPV